MIHQRSKKFLIFSQRTQDYTMKNKLFSTSGLLSLILLLSSCTENANSEKLVQAQLGSRSAKIIEAEGFQFKDLNKNGELDPYEDWRLTPEARAEDLVEKMSLEQKAGLMLISSTRLENDWSFDRPQTSDPIASGFNENDVVREVNMFTRKPLEYPNMFFAGTTKDVTAFHKRHFILRANPPVQVLAEWSNNLQALCERDGFGIPATITSNPRNHISVDASVGLSLGETPFTQWPGELGLAAMRDPELVRTFADMARQEWVATGIRKGYMYMADLATDPRWQRIEGTFGEDAELAAEVMREVVLGFQGEALSSNAVALTTKHFPGGGAAEGGQDPHFDWGKREVFPGGMFETNLIPFKAAIEAGTSSIMPYYSYPVGTDYPEVGYAFNKPVLQGLLREKLGFKGIINSDTGPIDMMPWGVEDLGIKARYKMAIEAGVNIFSGTANPDQLIETLKEHPELNELVDESVKLLLIEKFRLGMFENPYVDVAKASEIVGNPAFKEKADLAMRKSIVLLRNEAKTLPLAKGTKVYVESYIKPRGDASPSNVYIPENNSWELEFVQSPEEADVIVLWLIPKGKSLFQSDGSPLHVNLSANGIDVKYVNELVSKKPSILAINYTNPWAIDEIYDGSSSNIKAVLATFGNTPAAILDIVSGVFNPAAKMPFSTPVSDEVAQSQLSDVPGYMEEGDYEMFKFGEGLGYE